MRLLADHGAEYSWADAAAEAITKQVAVGKETFRRWALQSTIDGGTRPGVTLEESAEFKKLKAENR